jgi:hypothetical protein
VKSPACSVHAIPDVFKNHLILLKKGGKREPGLELNFFLFVLVRGLVHLD